MGNCKSRRVEKETKGNEVQSLTFSSIHLIDREELQQYYQQQLHQLQITEAEKREILEREVETLKDSYSLQMEQMKQLHQV